MNSVRALIHTRPVEKFQEPANASSEEREKLLQEYYARWREESLSWQQFEEALSSDPLLVSNAASAANGSAFAVRLGGFLDGERFDDIFCEVFIRGSRISAGRTDGDILTFEDFIGLGRDYWENFSNRRRKRDGS